MTHCTCGHAPLPLGLIQCKPSTLQVLLFSATLHSPSVREVAERLCQNPTLVDLKVLTLTLTRTANPNSHRPPRRHTGIATALS